MVGGKQIRRDQAIKKRTTHIVRFLFATSRLSVAGFAFRFAPAARYFPCCKPRVDADGGAVLVARFLPVELLQVWKVQFRFALIRCRMARCFRQSAGLPGQEQAPSLGQEREAPQRFALPVLVPESPQQAVAQQAQHAVQQQAARRAQRVQRKFPAPQFVPGPRLPRAFRRQAMQTVRPHFAPGARVHAGRHGVRVCGGCCLLQPWELLRRQVACFPAQAFRLRGAAGARHEALAAFAALPGEAVFLRAESLRGRGAACRLRGDRGVRAPHGLRGLNVLLRGHLHVHGADDRRALWRAQSFPRVVLRYAA